MTAATGNALMVVGRIRARLVSIILAQALLFGGAAGVFVAAASRHVFVGLVVGLVVTAIIAWRSRAVRSLERAALWVEERDTALHYELVTAVDPRYSSRPAPMYSGPLLRQAAWKAVWPAALALGIALATSGFVYKLSGKWGGGHNGIEGTENTAPINRLHPFNVVVVPPAYAHLPTQTLKEPSLVSALVGSVVTVSGPGSPDGLHAMRSDTDIVVHARDNDHWQVTLTMPTAPSYVQVSDGLQKDFVVLNPLPDLPPNADLILPAHDTVYITMPETLTLQAHLSDDYGLSEGHFEVLVTSGSEDAGGVKNTQNNLAATSFNGALSGNISTRLSLAQLGVKPGYVISISAVAHDLNTVSGSTPGQPQMGRSETRTIRIANRQDLDTVSVNAAAPPGLDSTYMTQKMIVIATEQLIRDNARKRPPLLRDSLEHRSAVLEGKEERLQSKVYELLHGDNSGGTSEGEAMSDHERALFDTAYNGLGDAMTSLSIALPKEALPREYVVLYALDSIRMMAKRYYYRGKLKIDPVNIAKARLQGTEKPDAGPRLPMPSDDTLRTRVALALTSILRGGNLSRRPAAADSLNLLQVATLKQYPLLAGALGEAASALRAKHDPMPALAKARKLLNGTVQADTSNTSWAGQ